MQTKKTKFFNKMLLRMGANKMNCDTEGHKQDRYDEASNEETSEICTDVHKDNRDAASCKKDRIDETSSEVKANRSPTEDQHPPQPQQPQRQQQPHEGMPAAEADAESFNSAARIATARQKAKRRFIPFRTYCTEKSSGHASKKPEEHCTAANRLGISPLENACMLRKPVETMQRSRNCCNDAARSKEVEKKDAPKKHSNALPIPSRKVEEANGLRTVELNGINAVGDEEWTEIEVAVDSGATETVMGEDTLAGVIDITERASMQARSAV